ncbi:MAG: hypothetical protein WAX89_06620 [Alphaproteobacteria bacterium]
MSTIALQSATLVFGFPLFALMFNAQWRYLSHFQAKRCALFMGLILLGGPATEVFFNTVYTWLFGQPLWVYQALPIAGGSTSWYAFFIWSLYGINVYFIDQRLAHSRTKRLHSYAIKSLIMGIEGPMLEVFFNLVFLAISGGILVHYVPADTWHFTSWQVMPIYAWCGLWAAIWVDMLDKYISWALIAALWGMGILSLLGIAYFGV